jgi:hypothetical protein
LYQGADRLERDEGTAGVSDAAYELTKGVHWLWPPPESPVAANSPNLSARLRRRHGSYISP